MNYLLLIAVIIASSGCAKDHVAKWDVPGTGPVICTGAEFKPCGLSLKGCGEKGDLVFECAKEAAYLGPGEHFEPVIYDEATK